MKQKRDENGRVLRDKQNIVKRWKNYFERLLNEENEREVREDGLLTERMVNEITREEVVEAIKKMKGGKSTEVGQIPVQVWKSLGEQGVNLLWNLMKKIWTQERIPDEWRESLFLPIYKGNGDTQVCGNYRGIKLMPHTLKIWERIIERRLREEVKVDNDQFGFIPGRYTTDAIFALGRLTERYREMQKELNLY